MPIKKALEIAKSKNSPECVGFVFGDGDSSEGYSIFCWFSDGKEEEGWIVNGEHILTDEELLSEFHVFCALTHPEEVA
jgi:hypothetical protein